MNRPHDFEPAELRAAEQAEAQGRDAGLRAELAALGSEPLPAAVRGRVLRMVRMRRRAPLLGALAAALALALVVPLALRTGTDPALQPGAAEAADLKQALEIIGQAGRNAMRVAGSSVAPHLVPPELGLERLPIKFFPEPQQPKRSDNNEPS